MKKKQESSMFYELLKFSDDYTPRTSPEEVAKEEEKAISLKMFLAALFIIRAKLEGRETKG